MLDREKQGYLVEPELAIVASLHYSKEPRLILGIPVVLFEANGIADYERLVALSLEAGKGSQIGYLLDVTQSLFSEFSYPISEELKKAVDVLQKNTLKSTKPFYDSPLPEVYLSYCLKKQDALQKKWNLIFKEVLVEIDRLLKEANISLGIYLFGGMGLALQDTIKRPTVDLDFFMDYDDERLRGRVQELTGDSISIENIRENFTQLIPFFHQVYNEIGEAIRIIERKFLERKEFCKWFKINQETKALRLVQALRQLVSLMECSVRRNNSSPVDGMPTATCHHG